MAEQRMSGKNEDKTQIEVAKKAERSQIHCSIKRHAWNADILCALAILGAPRVMRQTPKTCKQTDDYNLLIV